MSILYNAFVSAYFAAVVFVLLLAIGARGGLRNLAISLLLLCVFWSVGATALTLFGIIPTDSRTKLDVIRSMDDRGEVGLRVFPSAFLQMEDGRQQEDMLDSGDFTGERITMPLGGAPKLHSVFCREDDGWIVFESDRYGFRNADVVWNAPIEMLIVGDSFAESACVPESLTETLDDEHGIAAATLGSGGNGPLTEYAVLTEFLEAHKANTVYWTIFSNDLIRPGNHHLAIDFERELATPALARYLSELGFRQDYFTHIGASPYREKVLEMVEAKLEQDRPAGCARFLGSAVCRGLSVVSGRPVLLFAAQILRGGGQDAGWRELDAEVQEKALGLYLEGARRTRASQSRIVFVILPDKLACLGVVKPEPLSWLVEGLRARDETVIDLRGTAGTCELEFAKSGNHFSQKGYRKLARILAKDAFNLPPSEQ